MRLLEEAVREGCERGLSQEALRRGCQRRLLKGLSKEVV